MKKTYYINNITMDGGYCVVGTTYSFSDLADLESFAEAEGWELEEVEAPADIEEDMLVW